MCLWKASKTWLFTLTLEQSEGILGCGSPREWLRCQVLVMFYGFYSCEFLLWAIQTCVLQWAPIQKFLNKNYEKDVKAFRKALNKASYNILEAYRKIKAEWYHCVWYIKEVLFLEEVLVVGNLKGGEHIFRTLKCFQGAQVNTEASAHSEYTIEASHPNSCWDSPCIYVRFVGLFFFLKKVANFDLLFARDS